MNKVVKIMAAGEDGEPKISGAVDIAKFVLEFLVIGIHTELFGFNYFLDKGFGICSRLCVPFFFTVSAYFFLLKAKPLKPFLKRILTLYIIWSLIYLPFDLDLLRQMTIPGILYRFLWKGNEHGLWYLWGSIVGFCIVYFLLKFIRPEYVLIIAAGLLAAGTLKSTYANACYKSFGFRLPNCFGARNGLFYGASYIALGMAIAKSDTKGIFRSKKRLYAGLAVSMLLLAVESSLIVIVFGTGSTILWLSVFPCTYFLFEIVLNTRIPLDKTLSLTIRKMSTLMYVSQHLFIYPLSRVTSNMMLYMLTALASVVFSFAVIKLSGTRAFRFLQRLY